MSVSSIEEDEAERSHRMRIQIAKELQIIKKINKRSKTKKDMMAVKEE